MGTNSLAQSLGGVSPEQWATDFLTMIGAPVTPTNVGTIVKWEYGESGGGGGRYNPLNTTQGGYGGTSINGPGVKDYPDYLSGLNATVQAFMSGLSKYGYGNILNGLKAQDQAATFAAIDSSSWGTHDLPSGGSSTFTESPGVANPQSALRSAGGSGIELASAGGNDCLWTLPKITMPGPIPNVGGQCIISRSQGRALLGAASLAAGVALMMVGLAFVFSATKTGASLARNVSSAVGAAGVAAAI